MAKEIKLFAVTGLSPSVQLYFGSATVGPAISLTEIPGTGAYYGDVPGGTPYGQYSVVATAGSFVLASGELNWDGNQEMPFGLLTIGGFDPNNPAVNTPNSRIAGPYDLEVDGYGTNSTTVKRIT